MTTADRPLPEPRRPIVIAHRGASGYLPEHTLGAYALAVFQGADYIEPDLVMTRDGALIARHDNLLNLTTDVAARSEFAQRRRAKVVDGKTVTGWFSEDFTLAEIKRLRARERIPEVRPANARFDGQFVVPTLQEIVDLTRGLEKLMGRPIGLYPETKHPTYFRDLGLGMEDALVRILHQNGYRGRGHPVYIQSFEPSNLKALRQMTDLRLMQLLAAEGRPYDIEAAGGSQSYDRMATPEGLADVASYADAIGPDKALLLPPDANGRLDPARATHLVAEAHRLGLEVHPYTFRAENRFLAAYYRQGSRAEAFGRVEEELAAFLSLGIDGFFIDQPDAGLRARDRFLAHP